MCSPGNNDEPIPSDLVAGDPSFAEIVETFVAGLDKKCAAMKAALDAGSLSDLRTLAHQLKGTGGGHGYQVLTDVAAKLEQDAKTGELEKCKAGIDELSALFARIVVGPE